MAKQRGGNTATKSTDDRELEQLRRKNANQEKRIRELQAELEAAVPPPAEGAEATEELTARVTELEVELATVTAERDKAVAAAAESGEFRLPFDLDPFDESYLPSSIDVDRMPRESRILLKRLGLTIHRREERVPVASGPHVSQRKATGSVADAARWLIQYVATRRR